MHREGVEEHLRGSDPSLPSGVPESILHQRSMDGKFFAVLHQIHATVRFVDVELAMKGTHSCGHLLVYLAELDANHSDLSKVLS